MTKEDTLDEESIIKILWGKIGRAKKRDPFDDDAAWVPNSSRKRFVVTKADMLLATTDAPPQMSPKQLARKSVVSCVSDFSAKGVKPLYCTVSIALPKECAVREYVSGLAEGFSAAEKEYGVTIVGGDTNVTRGDTAIDCSIIGFADKVVPRKGAKAGDLVGVSGTFGLPPAGLLLLAGKAKTSDKSFELAAVDSVLNPNARLEVGLKASDHLTSCIDSSDGLALSLYHVAESSRVEIRLEKVPLSEGVLAFSKINGLSANDLGLFGGEEYELVATYHQREEKALSKLGFITIGTVQASKDKAAVVLDSELVPRRGWIHFRSES